MTKYELRQIAEDTTRVSDIVVYIFFTYSAAADRFKYTIKLIKLHLSNEFIKANTQWCV